MGGRRKTQRTCLGAHGWEMGEDRHIFFWGGDSLIVLSLSRLWRWTAAHCCQLPSSPRAGPYPYLPTSILQISPTPHTTSHPPFPISYPWASVQMGCILWCPSIADAACVLHLAYLLQPLCLRTFICHHVRQPPNCQPRPSQVCWRSSERTDIWYDVGRREVVRGGG